MPTIKAHSKYSASSSKRWVECPGSIQMIDKAPPPVESIYAAEGTIAHTWLEKMLKNPARTITIREQCYKAHGTEMASHVFHSAKIIREMQAREAQMYVEVKAPLDFIAPDMGGTADVVIAELFGRLKVIDFKYGKGIAVEPENNSQAIMYALGAAHKMNYNCADVELVIVQPRIEHEYGYVRSWVTDTKTLKQWGQTFRKAFDLSRTKNPPLKSGEHCRFCPAEKICPEFKNKALRRAQDDFADEP